MRRAPSGFERRGSRRLEQWQNIHEEMTQPDGRGGGGGGGGGRGEGERREGGNSRGYRHMMVYYTDIVEDAEDLSVDDVCHPLHVHLLLPRGHVTQNLQCPTHTIYSGELVHEEHVFLLVF